MAKKLYAIRYATQRTNRTGQVVHMDIYFQQSNTFIHDIT